MGKCECFFFTFFWQRNFRFLFKIRYHADEENRYLLSKLQDDLDKYVTAAKRRRRTAVDYQKEEEEEEEFFFFLILDRYSSSFLRRPNVPRIGERLK